MEIDKNKVLMYDIYHEASKMNEITQTELGQSVSRVYQNPYLSLAIRESYTVRPYAKKIMLKKNEINGNLGDILKKRRSARYLQSYDLTIDDVSNLFYYSYGITGVSKEMINGVEHVQALRAAPSAGAIYPLDMYLILLSSKELSPGIYHYNVIEHSIELIREGDFRKEIIRMMPNQYSLDVASAVLMLSAHFQKSTIKYIDRGYRFVLFDAGHLMQNVYLSLTAMGLGCYACGGFFDDDYNELIGIDGSIETSLYTSIIGKPVENK